MAILLMEGFDWTGQAANLTLRGWSSASGVNIVTGRFAANAIKVTNAATATYTRSLSSTYATLVAGFAIDPGNASAPTDIFVLRASGTSVLRVGLDSTPKLIVRNSGGTTIATGTTTIQNGVWYYIEVKGFINGASGTCEVKLNGVSEIASTVGNFGSTNFDAIGVVAGGSSSTNQHTFDDIYVLDTTGAAPRNDFLGDTRVVTIFPNGAGNYSQWTPDSGTNYARVDESTGTYPDGDTSYVSDSTPGHRDSYAFADIDGGASVYGVQINLWARKDDSATRQIAPFIRQGGTDYDGTTVTMASSYTMYSQLYNQDPTNNDWTAANVNGDEFGIKEIA